ncbi:MAG: T9SS type A sorting domain-containing protein [Bacteroidetes bacterium]|nr:T9SS type A sorting domain-containing protein [Bacteroidota bacterium]
MKKLKLLLLFIGLVIVSLVKSQTVNDVTGKVILNDKLSVVNALSMFNLNTQSGIYFVKITSYDKTVVKKLVVQ